MGAHLGKHKPVREPGKAGKAPMFQFHQSPKSCPGRSCPKESQGPAQHHRSALLKDCYETCLWKCFLLCLEAFFSKRRQMRKARNIPFFCQGKPSRHGVTNSPNPPCSSGLSPSASPPQNSPTCPCSPRATLEQKGHRNHGRSEPAELPGGSPGLRTHSFSHPAGTTPGRAPAVPGTSHFSWGLGLPSSPFPPSPAQLGAQR